MSELAARLQEALGPAYAVERPLGQGGFAVVFLVRDLNLKRKLAVKVLSPDLITSKTVLDRFRREAETVAQLSHPHIVPLHFIGDKEGLLYLAMACIEGGSLADRIEREKRLPVEEVSRFIREIASALDYAHRRGVIHRDIKPQNVLLEAETGRSLVTDFGIARTAEGGSLTATGMVVGTPAYLAPEQVTGEPSDHRADIYALGIVAYEMLAGEPPFTGPTPTAVLMKRLGDGPPPLAKVRADVPRGLLDVIEGMLAPDPKERFQSAGDVVRALGGATPDGGTGATAEVVRRSRRKRQRARVLLGLGGAGVLALGLIGVALLRQRRPVVVASVDPDMVVIAGGEYSIGPDRGPAAARPSGKLHVDPFGIDVGEVSVGEYAAFVDAGRASPPWSERPDTLLPVTGVRWDEAMRFCAWRHPPAGRLPTEVEWEAAARGLGGRAFPWGEAWDPARANTGSGRRGAPSRVGSYPGGNSEKGVQDLIGNVWEWTSSPTGGRAGTSPSGDGGAYRIIRGGAFDSPDSVASLSYRGFLPPDAARADLANTGFRCVMPLRGPG